jgi:hypothetical protein
LVFLQLKPEYYFKKINIELLKQVITKLPNIKYEDYYKKSLGFNHLVITRGAFSEVSSRAK